MPPRSNPFQNLVATIQLALAGTGVSVKSPLMLPDRHSGTLREVDVAVQGTMAGFPVVFAIECRDHAQPQDITWIDELLGKYEALPVDKIFAVSSSGFTPNAKAKAERHGIVCLELREANDLNWPEYLTGFKTVTIENFVLTQITHVHCKLGSASEDKDVTPDPLSCSVIDAKGRPICSLQAFVDGIVKSPRFTNGLSQRASGVCSFEARVSYRPIRFSVRLPDGISYKLLSLDLKGRCTKQRAIVSLKHLLYGDAAVAHGNLEALGHAIDIVVAQGNSQNERRIAFRIAKKSAHASRRSTKENRK